MKWRFGGVLFVALLTLLAGSAVWAQGSTGAISGKVLDTNGQPIPGADVVVTSKFLQGPRGTASNIDGEFMIPYLPPGNDYRLSVEAVGFNKVVQSNITVSLGSTLTLEVQLTSGGTEIEVTARPPVVTLKESKIQTNLSQEELEMLPIGRQYQDTLYLAPTVTSSGDAGNPGVAGSTSTENVFLINGLNTTDPVTGTFGTNLNYNFIREMEVATGGMEAEYGASTGGLFNVLTKSGTNEYHGEIFAYFVNENLAAKANSTDMNVVRPQPYHNYDYGFDIGGPIIKDRLWFFAGYNPSLFTNHVEGLASTTNIATGDVYEAPYKYDNLSRNWFWSAKFNYRVNDKHNLELSVFGDPSSMWFNEGQFPYLDKNALMTRRYQGGYNVALKWYATWTSKFFMEAGIGYTHSILQILPWTSEGYGIPSIVSINWAPALALNGGIGGYSFDDRNTGQFDFKGTYLAGKHEIKFGAGYEALKWDNYQNWTGNALYTVYRNRPGTNPFSTSLKDYVYYWHQYFQDPQINEKGNYTAAFLQDKWSLTDYITISAGVRWERNEVKPQRASGFSIDSWSPRIGFQWDFAKNGKSKLYANWGYYYQRVPISLAASMDPGHASYQDLYRNGTLYNRQANGVVPTTFLPGTKNQYNEEYLVGLEYELKPDLTVGFRAQFRSLGTVLEDVGYLDADGNLNYIVMNPGTSQWPAVMANWQGSLPGYEKFPSPIRNYQAYTITLNKRFSNRWFLNANYTWSQLRGNYEGGSGGYSLGQLNPNASSAYDVPTYWNIHNYYGLLQQDRTHQVKVQGSYKFDMGLVLGVNFVLQSGRPMNKFTPWPNLEDYYGNIFAVPRGSAGRMPTTWQMDIHAEYSFKLWKSDLAFFLDIFNVTNNQAQTGYYSTYYYAPDTWQDISSGNLTLDPNWGKTTARQGTRNCRLGVKWSF